MNLSFSDLKEQAKKAQQSAGSRVSSLRDQWQSSSSPSASSHASPSSHTTPSSRPLPPPVGKKPGPPALPGRTVSSDSTASATRALPPRNLPPSAHAPAASHAAVASAGGDGGGRIDWGALTEEDKEAFFSLLDEYFARRGYQEFASAAPPRAPPTRGPPPPIALATRPAAAPTPSQPPTFHTFDLPPSSTTASAFAAYFAPSAPWPTPWYTDQSSPLPPPLLTARDVQSSSSWSYLGTAHTRTGYILFADLSICWYRVQWSSLSPARPTSREARYRPPPAAWDGPLLLWAHELYGDALAAFAERAVASGQPVARGECWDLAHEALKSITAAPETAHFPPPVGSIGRTHGHLIYAGDGASGAGRWRGGDAQVRRGDIVEWNSVRIRTTADSPTDPGASMTLGDPEHTAIVLSAPSHPIPSASDGASLPPSALQWLEVAEQSLAHPPVVRRYDLGRGSFVKGRVWVYRAVPEGEYLGEGLEAGWPVVGESFEV